MSLFNNMLHSMEIVKLYFSAKKFLDTEGDLMKLRHEIQCVLPHGYSQVDCIELQVEAKDWVPFENAKFSLEEPSKAPLMKNMPPNYRLKLKPMDQPESSKPKVVRKRIVKRPRKRAPKSEDIIELSDSEVKAKKLKQQKLNQMKKVSNNTFLFKTHNYDDIRGL